MSRAMFEKLTLKSIDARAVLVPLRRPVVSKVGLFKTSFWTGCVLAALVVAMGAFLSFAMVQQSDAWFVGISTAACAHVLSGGWVAPPPYSSYRSLRRHPPSRPALDAQISFFSACNIAITA